MKKGYIVALLVSFVSGLASGVTLASKALKLKNGKCCAGKCNDSSKKPLAG